MVSVGVLADEARSETRDVGSGHGSSTDGICGIVAPNPSACNVTAGAPEIEGCLFSLALDYQNGRRRRAG